VTRILTVLTAKKWQFGAKINMENGVKCIQSEQKSKKRTFLAAQNVIISAWQNERCLLFEQRLIKHSTEG